MNVPDAMCCALASVGPSRWHSDMARLYPGPARPAASDHGGRSGVSGRPGAGNPPGRAAPKGCLGLLQMTTSEPTLPTGSGRPKRAAEWEAERAAEWEAKREAE